MLISFDSDRPSDPPFIERVWTSHGERAGTFLFVVCALGDGHHAPRRSLRRHAARSRNQTRRSVLSGQWRVAGDSFQGRNVHAAGACPWVDGQSRCESAAALEAKLSAFAVRLLQQGMPIADVVWRCGFYDHAPLT